MRPFTLLIKPAGPDCNIACEYCFYSGKTNIFGADKHRMSNDILEELVRSYLKLGFPVNSMAFQGGEPSLMGVGFYEKLIELQQKYAQPGQEITNALQTNGTLLDEKWCRFLAKNKFLVGISLDGPQKYHDYYRKDHAGQGTWQRVMRGIANCRKYGVEYNILVLLNKQNVVAPDELFDFFIEQQVDFLQFVQCMEWDHHTGQIADFSITPQQYGDFLCRIYDRWIDYGPEKISIRTFDSVMSYLLRGQHTECTFGPRCNDYIVIEHNGDAFCCDFFVEPQWRLGNIMETPIEQLAGSPLKRKFARRKWYVANKCQLCRWLDICRGGCPKDRIPIEGSYRVPSYFCQGYKQFFAHTVAGFEQLVARLQGNGPQ